MKLHDQEKKHNLVTRLKRIEGQVRGVQAMLDDDRECREILQQLTAIRSAVQGVTLAVLQDYAVDCLISTDADEPGKREQVVEDLVTLLGRLP